TPRSAQPSRLSETPAPEITAALKPACSTSLALKPLKIPGKIRMRWSSTRERKLAVASLMCFPSHAFNVTLENVMNTHQSRNQEVDVDNDKPAVSRREFGALSLGAGLATVANTSANAAAPALTETEVTVKTPDGMCDAAFIHPATGSYPGVLIWTDVFGLRPSMRGFARRIAAEGYSVLVPNPFYRTAKAPVFAD